MKTSIIFLITFIIANTSFADSTKNFKVSIKDWSFIVNSEDTFFSHPHKTYSGVLTKKMPDFAPSLLVFKLDKSFLKNINIRTWMEIDLFNNKLSYLKEEKSKAMKIFVYKSAGDSIVYAYIFSTPKHYIVLTQDTNTELQTSDFNATKFDLEKIEFTGL